MTSASEYGNLCFEAVFYIGAYCVLLWIYGVFVDLNRLRKITTKYWKPIMVDEEETIQN